MGLRRFVYAGTVHAEKPFFDPKRSHFSIDCVGLALCCGIFLSQP